MDVSVDNEVIVNTNGTVEVAVGNAADAVVADDHALDITVTKKEYKIVGDEVYIAKLYDDAPQWMKDLVQLVVDNTMETESVILRNDLIGQLNQFATSYVPLNAYTQSIIDLSNADTAMHDTLETLNSNFNDGLNTANSQIIDLQSTKASKTEVATKVIETLTAQLATPTSELGATIGNLQQTIVDGDSANADSVTTLMSVLEGEVDARASAIETINTYVGIDEAGASTGTGLSAYLEGSDGTVGGVDSELVNTIRATSSEVESKFAYNSNLSLHGTTYSSGFGLATSLVDGTIPTGQSEFWIKSDKFRLMAADGTTKSGYSPFSVNAATGDILMNGSVKFINTSGGNSTLQDVVQGYVETVQVGDKNINITDNLIPMASMLTDIANAGYQFVATPVKTSTAGISVYAEPQVQLDVGDEIYSPFVNELVVSYYYRFGIKGITALTNVKICTIDAVDAVTYGDISYTVDAGQTLVDTDWYIIDGLINPAGGSTGVGGSIRKTDGTKIGTVNVYVMPAGSTKLLLGWIGACTVSRCKLAKVNADTVTGDLASIDYVNSAVGSLGDLAYENVVEAAKLGSTVIDGGYIKSSLLTADNIVTGQLNANRLAPASGTSTVWSGGGLVSSNFNGNSTGSIGTPTQGFRLSSNAASTSTDPNIYGGYIKGGTIEGAQLIGAALSVNDIKVAAVGYPANFGPIMIQRASAGYAIGTHYSGPLVSASYGTGYLNNRLCSATQTFFIEANSFGLIHSSQLYVYVAVDVSNDGTNWTQIAAQNTTVSSQSDAIYLAYTYTTSNATVYFRSRHWCTGSLHGTAFKVFTINGQ